MLELGKDVLVHPTARINVANGYIGDRSIIRENAVIEGNRVEIGHEAFIDAYAWIGGGSCWDPNTHLSVGDFLHMGRYSHINFAMPVAIGHEFGCGMGTRIFSHGAYLPAWEGFPVQWEGVTIGNRVWMPHAWVNPGVKIGSNVVIAAMSLVNKDLPDGCLAGGIPAKVIRENAYPKELSHREKIAFFSGVFNHCICIVGESHYYYTVVITPFSEIEFVIDGETTFAIDTRVISGPATRFTETLKDQLRRNGVRFRYAAVDGEYRPWAGF